MTSLVHHLLADSAVRIPDKEALVHGDRRLSYAEVLRLTQRLAGGFRAAGLERGDRVGVCLEKSVEQTVAIMAALWAGGVFVPINHLLFPQQIGHIVRDCEPRVLVTTEGHLVRLREELSQGSSVQAVVVVDGAEDSGRHPRVYSLSDILDSETGDGSVEQCISKDLAAILYTSGSTGRPKGVVLSHANLIAGSRIVSTYLGITERERILSIVPFSFDYGLNQLLTGFEHGATVVLLNFHFPDEVVRALLDEQITGLAGVPSFWCLLAQPRSSIHRHEFPHLRYITNTGGVVPATVVQALQKALPATSIVLMYGLTEAFRSTYLPPEELNRRRGSMGRAIPDTEIFVVNDEGKKCGPNEVGELVHRGPTVSLGYWGNPEATAKVLRPNPFQPPQIADTERVCYSGDLVRMDEQGFLYFCGRRDATIKSAGFRISPNEVEEVALSTGRVLEAAAIGVPDEVLGHSITLFVVPQDGETIETVGLIDYYAERVPRYMIPKKIEFASEHPKTAHGKIDYPTLRSSVTGSR